jgi:hypothetical protein
MAVIQSTGCYSLSSRKWVAKAQSLKLRAISSRVELRSPLNLVR